jgi:hypothetical protein
LHENPGEILSKFDHSLPTDLVLSASDGLERPLDGFRLCHPYSSTPHGDVVFETLSAVPLEGDPEGRFSYQHAVTRYLELFMVQALATILKEVPQAGYLQLRITFPNGQSKRRVKALSNCIDHVVESINDLTGFPTAGKRYIDRARAAALSFEVPEGFCLVMNMSGETTELALLERRKGRELGVVFVDGLAYGCNHFLRILASNEHADLFPEPTEPLNPHYRFLWLVRRVQLQGFAKMVSTHYVRHPGAREQMLNMLLHFYSGIAYYVSRLFQALTLHRGSSEDLRLAPVACYMIGEGWALADALPCTGLDREGSRLGAFCELLEAEGFSNLTPVARPWIEDWPCSESAINYGALSADERALTRSITDVEKQWFDIQTICGFDFHLADGLESRQDVSWHRKIPLFLDDRDLRPVFSSVELPERWKEFIRFRKGAEVGALEELCTEDIVGVDKPRLVRSPLARFLESIYLEQIQHLRKL